MLIVCLTDFVFIFLPMLPAALLCAGHRACSTLFCSIVSICSGRCVIRLQKFPYFFSLYPYQIRYFPQVNGAKHFYILVRRWSKSIIRYSSAAPPSRWLEAKKQCASMGQIAEPLWPFAMKTSTILAAIKRLRDNSNSLSEINCSFMRIIIEVVSVVACGAIITRSSIRGYFIDAKTTGSSNRKWPTLK